MSPDERDTVATKAQVPLTLSVATSDAALVHQVVIAVPVPMPPAKGLDEFSTYELAAELASRLAAEEIE